MKTRTAQLVVVVGIATFVAVEIGKCNRPVQTRSTSSPVAQYPDSRAKVEAESTPDDSAAKQRAIDAELASDRRRGEQ